MKFRENIQRFLAKGERIMRDRGYRKKSEISVHDRCRKWGLTDEEWQASVKQTAFTPRNCSCYLCKRYEPNEKSPFELREQLRIQEELESL